MGAPKFNLSGNEVRINIESWHSYNNGMLLGKWHDITGMTQDEIEDLFTAEAERMTNIMHQKIGATYGDCEELFIADSEAPYGLDIEEDDSPEKIAEIVEVAEKLDSFSDAELRVEILKSDGLDLDIDNLDSLDDRLIIHLGSCFSEEREYEELGEYIINECGYLEDVPAHLQSYIDYTSYGRDMVLNGEFTIYNIAGDAYAVSY